MLRVHSSLSRLALFCSERTSAEWQSVLRRRRNRGVHGKGCLELVQVPCTHDLASKSAPSPPPLPATLPSLASLKLITAAIRQPDTRPWHSNTVGAHAFLQHGSTVARHTAGGRHGLAGEAANDNMKLMTDELLGAFAAVLFGGPRAAQFCRHPLAAQRQLDTETRGQMQAQKQTYDAHVTEDRQGFSVW